MLQFSDLTIETVIANQEESTFSSAKPIEEDIISKNRRSSKSQMSRGNFFQKVLLLGLLCLFCTLTLFATKPKLVTVTSGDISVIKKPSIAFLEINFSDMKVGDETFDEYQKRRGDNFISEWSTAVESTNISFKNFFNKKNKNKMQLTTEVIDASYKFTVKVSSLNMGDSFSMWIPLSGNKAGGMHMYGSIDIIDMENNNVVCTLNVNGVKGSGLPYLINRLQTVFNYLADNICVLK